MWRVVCSDGALKLEPENDRAKRVSRCVQLDCRYPARDFDKVVLCRKQWVSVHDAELLFGPTWLFGDDVPTQPEAQPNSLFSGPTLWTGPHSPPRRPLVPPPQ